MNDTVATELQLAHAELARSTPAQARRTLAGARQLDRAREIDTVFFVLFEVACLMRDNRASDAVNALKAIAPLRSHDWIELDRLLSSVPENKFPAFVAACAALRSQVHSPSAQPGDPPPPVPPAQSGGRYINPF